MAILVPYDGSTPAQKAVEHAVGVADGEEIILLRVVEAAGGTIDAGFDLLQEKLREEPKEVTAAVADEVADLLTDVDYDIETVAGKPARQIVRFAEENDVDQIIIGSHGRRGASRILLGSVAETVVRRSPVTVTVVR